jgi:hypothetical protein
MKTGFLAFLSFFAFSSIAFSMETDFYCKSTYGMEIKGRVIVKDRNNYEISLKSSYSRSIPVHYKKIEFNDAGGMLSIETSGLVESFSIYSRDGEWSGEYWFDNAYYPLTCQFKSVLLN